VFTAPFAVFLNDDDKNYVEPDIAVVCDKNKLDERGCNGAPDWIIEIISSSTSRMDYGIKLFKYRTCGVKEYWIVNPLKKTVNVFDFANNDEKSGVYIFDDKIASCTYPNLEVRISDYF
jgi:Uma2 family endonuclease